MGKIKTEMVGQSFGPFEIDYDFAKFSLFALGSGCAIDGKRDLEYVYEGTKGGMKVLPTFAAMPIVESIVTKTIDYGYNYAGSLHWSFDITFHQPINHLVEKAGKLSTTVELKGLFDRGEGKGLLAQHVGETRDEAGDLLFTNESWDCLIYDGGWGGPAAPKDIVEMPDREPDFVVEELIPENQALIYRLSGDFHPQHVDWEYAAENGQPRPILHAVSFAGFVCRHFIETMIPGEPERLTRFKTRITASVLPGTTVRTEMWKMDEGRVHFRLVNADDPSAKPFLNWGVIEWK